MEGRGAWIRADAAAVQLDVSEKTVKRRARTGALPSRLVPTPHGRAWEVWLDVRDTERQPDPPSATPERDTEGHESGGEAAELARLVSRQQDQLVQLAGRIGWLEAQLQQRDAQLLALGAGEGHQTRTEGHQAASGPEVVPEPPRRPWWRFWGNN